MNTFAPIGSNEMLAEKSEILDAPTFTAKEVEPTAQVEKSAPARPILVTPTRIAAFERQIAITTKALTKAWNSLDEITDSRPGWSGETAERVFALKQGLHAAVESLVEVEVKSAELLTFVKNAR